MRLWLSPPRSKRKAAAMNLQDLIKKYGSKENAYKALHIAKDNAHKANNQEAVKKFEKLISVFDREYGIFSI